MFGTSPAAKAPRAFPSSSKGLVSQMSFGVGGGCAGNVGPPTHGSEGSYVAVSLLPEALQTVTSLSANVLVRDSLGITPCLIRRASFGSVMTIVPYSPLKIWFVEEW